MEQMETPKTLVEAARYFADVAVCEDYMRDIRWSGGAPVCPACKSERIGEIATRRLLRCRACRKQFSARDGTPLEHSPLSLRQWFVAIWSEANCDCSTVTLAAAMGCTQRSAWLARARIRAAKEIA